MPRFDSQLSSSQRNEDTLVSLDEPQQDETVVSKVRRGNKRPTSEKTGLVFKVKLPKFGVKSTVEKSKASTPRWVNPTKRNDTQREHPQSSGPGSDSVREKDVYYFSEEQPKSEKDKVKIAVLRNISRMLAENNHIRQRLMSLTQVNRSDAD